MTPTEQAIAALEAILECGCSCDSSKPMISAAIAALKADPWRPISEAAKQARKMSRVKP